MRAAVEVWCVDLAVGGALSAADLGDLSDDERARMARYLVPAPAHVFARTRLALRRLLGRRLGVAAAAVRIGVGPHGKPFAVEAPALAFNVSHCPSLALIAFCDDADVGVDVEQPGAAARLSTLEASVCSPAELAWVRRQGVERDAAVLRLWTRKEAVLKACGLGLAQTPATLDLGPPAAASGRTLQDASGPVLWTDLALPAGESGAVAVRSDQHDGLDVTLHTDTP